MPSNAELVEACRQSKQFFFEHYYKIPIVGKGSQPFVMYDCQKFISDQIDKNPLIIGLKARQIGWTTIGVANSVWDALFHVEHPWLYVSRNEDAAQKMLEKAAYAYYHLPEWMKRVLPRIKSQTQSSLVFDNGSRIESVPATGSTGRGDSVYGALMDECAFMEYAEEIWGAVEPLVYGPAMLFSTANGMGNFFHEVWLDSQREDSVWTGIFFPWDVIEKRHADGWYDLTKRAYRGREWLFYQEYPKTPQEAFAKSGRVAFASDVVLDCYEPMDPERRLEWVIGGTPKDIGLADDPDIVIDIWREPTVIRDDQGRPIWKPNYVVGADIAEGLEHGDFTYVTVFDVNTGEQVASSTSSIPVSYLNDLLDWLGRYYMTALMIPERNNAGILPIDRLYRDNWYPRMYRMERFAAMHLTDRTPEYGWKTTPGTKPKMVLDFQYALAEKLVILHDPLFVVEAQTFIADGRGSYSATSNNHDDAIMGTLVAYQGVLDSYKYEIIWRDEVRLPPTHDEVDALIFNTRKTNNEDRLELPLGKEVKDESSRKSIVLFDQNFVKGGL